ncbi:MAG: hypothetical protein ACHQTE_02415 [Candidatus Saccharimonadales bacterium]
MSKSAKRRMIENEAVFRKHNEQIKKNFNEAKRVAAEDNQPHMLVDEDQPLFFHCECADEDCRQRIELKPSVYNEIHESRDRFVVLPGHEVVAIEQTVGIAGKYYIVEKDETPPEDVSELQSTSLNNA